MPEVDSETVLSGLTFCGYLLFYLSKNHCWADGNKRAAWMSVVWVLEKIGLTVEADDDEVINFCESILTAMLRRERT